MELHQAILKYLSIYDNSNLDEGIFYNVLRDMNAFNNRPAYQNIVRAFIKKGFLKEIWCGRKDWLIKSIQYLKENQGFQSDKVDEVIDEFKLGFKSFVPIPIKDKITIDRTNVNIREAGSFNKYEKKELLSVHPQRPGDFFMKKGDIVFVKNGIARISEIHNEYLQIAANVGIINKSGAWYAYNGDKIGQGRENAKIYLKENPAFCDMIEGMVREHYFNHPEDVAEASSVEDDEE